MRASKEMFLDVASQLFRSRNGAPSDEIHLVQGADQRPGRQARSPAEGASVTGEGLKR